MTFANLLFGGGIPRECRNALEYLDGNGKDVLVAHGLPLLKGKWRGGHGLIPSDHEKWKSVAITIPPSLP